MYSNGINERQNQEINLMRLAAMRQLYSDSKFLFNIKFIICTALVILGNLLVIFKGQNDLIDNALLFIKIISAIIPLLVFDKWINSKKGLAATIQEEFDSNVLNTSWNDKLCGDKGIHDQEIIFCKKKYVTKSGNGNWQSSLINWYDIRFSQMPLSIGRVYCQATNINWDKELRMKFNKIAFIVLMIILLILFVVSSMYNMKFLDSVDYIFLPFAPMIIFLVQIIKANNKTLSELYELRNHLDTVIIEKENPKNTDEKLSELSNRLQAKIYEYRQNAFLIPDKLYLIYRSKQENLMSDYASLEKQKFENNKQL